MLNPAGHSDSPSWHIHTGALFNLRELSNGKGDLRVSRGTQSVSLNIENIEIMQQKIFHEVETQQSFNEDLQRYVTQYTVDLQPKVSGRRGSLFLVCAERYVYLQQHTVKIHLYRIHSVLLWGWLHGLQKLRKRVNVLRLDTNCKKQTERLELFISMSF